MHGSQTIIFPASIILACVVARPSEAAAGPDDGPSCNGSHSLWAPVPDACLDVIDTDRPHQTDTPHVLPAGHTQVESAVAELQLGGTLGAPPADRTPHVVLFDDNYKFGVVSRVDVQLLFAHAAYVPAQGRFEPPGPLSLRAKFNVVDEKGWVPAVTLVPWMFLPVAPSEALRGGPLVFWGWELPAHLELEVNAGVLFGVAPKAPVAIVLASALTYTVVGDFRVFVDVYATGPDAALGTGGALGVRPGRAGRRVGTYGSASRGTSRRRRRSRAFRCAVEGGSPETLTRTRVGRHAAGDPRGTT